MSRFTEWNRKSTKYVFILSFIYKSEIGWKLDKQVDDLSIILIG